MINESVQTEDCCYCIVGFFVLSIDSFFKNQTKDIMNRMNIRNKILNTLYRVINLASSNRINFCLELKFYLEYVALL